MLGNSVNINLQCFTSLPFTMYITNYYKVKIYIDRGERSTLGKEDYAHKVESV